MQNASPTSASRFLIGPGFCNAKRTARMRTGWTDAGGVPIHRPANPGADRVDTLILLQLIETLCCVAKRLVGET